MSPGRKTGNISFPTINWHQSISPTPLVHSEQPQRSLPTASGRTKGESLGKSAYQVEENIYPLTKTTIMVAFISYGENLVSQTVGHYHAWMKRERPPRSTSSGASIVTRLIAQAAYSRFPWVRGIKPGVPVMF